MAKFFKTILIKALRRQQLIFTFTQKPSKMKTLFSLLFLVSFSFCSYAQTDTEFPKEFIMHAKLHNGMVTSFHRLPDLYVGGIQLVPQYTIITHKLRGGIIGDVYYTGKKVQAAIGPTISLKLETFKAGMFGSVGNLHLNIDHLWGTNKERLLGGGINADLGNKLIIALTAHRDYNGNTWWLQNSIGIRISKLPKPIDINN